MDVGQMTERAAPARAGGAHDGPAPVDLAHLARYTLGNRTLEREVLLLFVGQTPLTLAQLGAARTDQAWKEAVHTLKGSARAVGAWRIAHCAEQAETADAVDHRGRILCDLRAALEEARAFIATLDASSG